MNEGMSMNCVIRTHFTCDGTGLMCGRCGESEYSCCCDDGPFSEDCEECGGTGRICVAHERPADNTDACDEGEANS